MEGGNEYMTRSIDERIVQMRFDNQQFERNISTSTKSLDRLKSSLNLQNAAKGFNQFEKSAGRFSLDSVIHAIGSATSKFNALGVVGFTVIENLTNSAMRLGERITSALTVDPILTGLSEYELKMNSIQTILTNTESKGTTLDQVNAALDELNTYADKTIYNFAQMTDNIGKFTAAGVGLEDSVTAIKGISNVAAGFGVDATRMAGATYQISQALRPGGYFQLIDWKSLEIAGLAGEKLRVALEKTANEMGIFRDETVPFRNSLKDGWLTTEVFIETMKKMAVDKSLLAAATNVTTFTKLLGVMKETMGSGWAQTWEAILGGKDKSTALWTSISEGFGEVISASAQARTELFKFWDEQGGRQAVLEGISNVLILIADVLKPIEEAFAEVFKPLTGGDLVTASNRFRDFTAGLKIGADLADKIKTIFKGLFSVVRMLGKAVVVAAKGVKFLVENLTPLGETTLNLLVSIGQLFFDLDRGVFTVQNITASLYKWAEALKPIGTLMKIVIVTIQALLQSFIDSRLEDGAQIIDNIAQSFEVFNDKAELVKAGVYKMIQAVVALFVIFQYAGVVVYGATMKMVNAIREFLSVLNVAEVFSILNSGIVTAFGLTLVTFASKLSKTTGGLSGIIEVFTTGITNMFKDFAGLQKQVSGVLDGIKGSLIAYQNELKARALIKIAAAIGLLALSFLLIAQVDSEKTLLALSAIGTLIAELFAAMIALNKLSIAGMVGITKGIITMIAISAAILILASALTKIAKIPFNGIVKGLIGVAGLLTLLVATSALMSKNAVSFLASALSMVILSKAIGMLADAMSTIGILSVKQIIKGLGTIGAIMIELSLFSLAAKGVKIRLFDMAKLFILAATLNRFATTVETFGKMDINKLKQGLLSIGILLGGIVIFESLRPIKMGALNILDLIAVATALTILSGVVEKLGKMSILNIKKGLVAMGGILSIISFFNLINSASKKAFLGSMALKILSKSLVTVSDVLTSLSKLSWDQIKRSLTALGGSLAILNAALLLMPATAITNVGTLIGAVGSLLILADSLTMLSTISWEQIKSSLTVMAASLAILVAAVYSLQAGTVGTGVLIGVALALLAMAPALKMIGSISLGGAIIGLGALVGVLTTLGVAAYFLGPLLPVILGIAGAIALLGVAVGVAAIGMGAMAAGTALLVTAMVALFTLIAASGPAIVVSFTSVMSIIPMFIQVFNDSLNKLWDGLISVTPKMVKWAVDLTDQLLDALASLGPKIGEITFLITNELLKSFAKYSPTINEYGYQILLDFMRGLNDNIEELTIIGNMMIVNMLNGMAKTMDEVVDAAYEFTITFINEVEKSIRENSEELQRAIVGLNVAIMNAFTLSSDLVLKEIARIALGWGNKLLEELKKIPDKVYAEVENIGKNVIAGLENGISENSNPVVRAVSKMGLKVIDAAEEVFDTHSPSEIFRKIGLYLMRGQKLGIEQGTPEVVEAITNSSKKVTAAATKETAKSVKDAFDAAVDSIEERKYFDKLSLDEELKEWQFLNKTFSEYAEYRKKTAREVYRVEKAIRQRDEGEKEKSYKDEYNQAIESINNRKYYKQLSLEEELKEYQDLQKIYEEGSEERKQIDKDVYRVRNEIEQDSYDKSIDLIDEKKYYNELALTEELAAHKKIRDSVKKDSDMRKKADREIFRVEQEIRDANNEYIQDMDKLQQEANDRRIALEEEYYDKTKSIHDKLKQDIKSVTDEYNNAVTSRTDTLYSAYGLFDEIKLPEKEEDKIKGTQLLNNLQGQVKAFKNWQVDIDKLAARGVGEDLIQELRKLGPKSGQEIDALTQLSDKELTKYTSLWRSKHALAKTQATEELEGMRTETVTKIQELTKAASVELNEYVKVWSGQMMTVVDDTTSAMKQLKRDWASEIGNMRGAAEFETELMCDNMIKKINAPDWSGLASNVIGGYVTGMKDESIYAVEETGKMAEEILQTAKDALGVESPSKEFMAIGEYTIKGLIAGIQNMSGQLVKAIDDTAELMKKGITQAINNILSIINDDINLRPVITPVLDMSDFNANKDLLGLSAYRPILPRTIPSEPSQTPRTTSQNGSGVNNNFNISSLVVREDADVKRIARQLQLLQRNESRG